MHVNTVRFGEKLSPFLPVPKLAPFAVEAPATWQLIRTQEATSDRRRLHTQVFLQTVKPSHLASVMVSPGAGVLVSLFEQADLVSQAPKGMVFEKFPGSTDADFSFQYKHGDKAMTVSRWVYGNKLKMVITCPLKQGLTQEAAIKLAHELKAFRLVEKNQ